MSDDLVKRLGTPLNGATVQQVFKERGKAKKRIEELEAKLAQQDDLVQAAVAAALTEAAQAIQGDEMLSPVGAHRVSARILALIPEDAQAALDRVVAAEREQIAKMIEGKAPFTPEEIAQTSDIDRFAERRTISGSRAYHALAAAIRKGGE